MARYRKSRRSSKSRRSRSSRGRSARRSSRSSRRSSRGRSRSRNPLSASQRRALKWMRGQGMVSVREARSARAWKKGRSPRTSLTYGKRMSTRKYIDRIRGQSGAFSYRGNPASSQFRDGTTISISGRSVTLSTPYGETYEYSEVSPSGLLALYGARNLAAARKALNRSGILSSINPKRGRSRKSRGRGKSRSRRNCGYSMNPRRRGRGRSRSRR